MTKASGTTSLLDCLARFLIQFLIEQLKCHFDAGEEIKLYVAGCNKLRWITVSKLIMLEIDYRRRVLFIT